MFLFCFFVESYWSSLRHETAGIYAREVHETRKAFQVRIRLRETCTHFCFQLAGERSLQLFITPKLLITAWKVKWDAAQVRAPVNAKPHLKMPHISSNMATFNVSRSNIFCYYTSRHNAMINNDMRIKKEKLIFPFVKTF